MPARLFCLSDRALSLGAALGLVVSDSVRHARGPLSHHETRAAEMVGRRKFIPKRIRRERLLVLATAGVLSKSEHCLLPWQAVPAGKPDETIRTRLR